MTKDEIYARLSERVQREGGYVAIPRKSRPMVKMIGSKKEVTVAAVFEGTDDSSPLKLVTSNFHACDVYDYCTAEDMEHILSRMEK